MILVNSGESRADGDANARHGGKRDSQYLPVQRENPIPCLASLLSIAMALWLFWQPSAYAARDHHPVRINYLAFPVQWEGKEIMLGAREGGLKQSLPAGDCFVAPLRAMTKKMGHFQCRLV